MIIPDSDHIFLSVFRRAPVGVQLTFVLAVLLACSLFLITLFSTAGWIDKPFPGFLLNKRMVPSNIGCYDWTGTKAGLKTPDKVLEINGVSVNSPKELNEHVRNLGGGVPVNYTIAREEDRVNLFIDTMIFTKGHFFIVFGVFLLSGFFYLFLGSVVFVMKPGTEKTWPFFLLCFFLSLFMVAAADVSSQETRFWNVYFLASAFFPAAGIHLSGVFPEEKLLLKKHPRVRYVPYLFAFAAVAPVILLYPSMIAVRIYGYFISPLMILSALALVASVLLSLFRKTSQNARQRAKVVLFGVALAFPLPAIVITLSRMGLLPERVHLLNNFMVFPLVFFPASIAYSVARHNLFDVDLFIKRALGYGIMTALVGSLYVALALSLEPAASLVPALEKIPNLYTIFFALLVLFFFRPIHHRLQKIVNRLFYREEYDYKSAIKEISSALTSILDFNEIIIRILHAVRDLRSLDSAGVILFPPLVENYQTVFVLDSPGKRRGEETIRGCPGEDDPVVSLVRRERKMITKYDISEEPDYAGVKKEFSALLEKLKTTLVFPMVRRNEVVGMLALGEPKSGKFYSNEDVELLNTLVNQGAIALENARLAEKMRDEEIIRANLARYLSPQVVDSVMRRKVDVDLGGDRKVVTVLISDIRGFTSLTETQSPERLVSILNEYFTEMAQVVFGHQGSLDKYVGDAIVAVFGSLIDLENQTDQAVHASLAMMRKMALLNAKWAVEEEGFHMDIGVGIDTGEVFLGNLGSLKRMEFTVLGSTVNNASILSDEAGPGEILITEKAAANLDPGIPTRKHVPVFGKKGARKINVREVVFRKENEGSTYPAEEMKPSG